MKIAVSLKNMKNGEVNELFSILNKYTASQILSTCLAENMHDPVCVKIDEVVFDQMEYDLLNKFGDRIVIDKIH